jgi:hypothetical protein
MTAIKAAAWCAFALAASSCRSPAPPRVLVLDDGVKMGADGRILSLIALEGYLESNPAWNGREIALSAAGGETVAFQVALQAGGKPLPAGDVRISTLRREGGGRLPAPSCVRFREWYLPVTLPSRSPGGSAGPGEYPDALIPAETPGWGLPVDVPAGRTQSVWIDCAVPGAAQPGTYHGSVEVTGGGRELARLGLRLEVRTFSLPQRRHLRWRTGYTGWEAVPRALGVAEESAEWLELEEQLYELLWSGHRLAPTTHYHDLPLPTRVAGDTMEIEWSGFDRRFGRYLDGSAFSDREPLRPFSLPINLHAGWPGRRYATDEARVDTWLLETAARLTGRHWDERGWRAEDAFVYVADEPAPARWGAVRKACEALRRGEPRFRASVAFYTEFSRSGAELVRQFAECVTMWDVAGDHLDLPALKKRQAAGDTVGFYQGGEPYQGSEALDGDGLALTTWPWIAWRYGLDTLFLYNATEWSYFRLDRATDVPWARGKREIWENPLNQSWQTNGQGVLVYPGAYVGIRGVVPSIRLKQVRRGMQDYEYLWLAQQAGQGAAADEAARRLIPRALHEAGPLGAMGARGAWERDPRVWAEARLRLARAIAEARAPSAPVTPRR